MKVMIRCFDCRHLWGVVCVVDVPFGVMSPTHNKQDFHDRDELRLLRNSINDHFEQYWFVLLHK